MDYLWSFANPKIPDFLWGLSFFVLCFVMALTCIFTRKGRLIKRVLFSILLIEYVTLLLCSTIIMRIPSAGIHYKTELFWSYVAITNGRTELIAENLLNIFVFIPLGLLLSTFECFNRWWIVLIIGLLLSTCIELSQFIFQSGLGEFDDIFHNTLGAIIGYWIVLLLNNLKNRNMQIVENIWKFISFLCWPQQGKHITKQSQSYKEHDNGN